MAECANQVASGLENKKIMRGGYSLPLCYFFFCFKFTHNNVCARSCPNGCEIQFPIAEVQIHVESRCQAPYMDCPRCHTRLISTNVGDERGKLIHITYIITWSSYYGVKHFLFSSNSRVFIST